MNSFFLAFCARSLPSKTLYALRLAALKLLQAVVLALHQARASEPERASAWEPRGIFALISHVWFMYSSKRAEPSAHDPLQSALGPAPTPPSRCQCHRQDDSDSTQPLRDSGPRLRLYASLEPARASACLSSYKRRLHVAPETQRCQ